MATHKSNIALWSGFFVLVLFCYHLFSDGDFSFLMVRTALCLTVCLCVLCTEERRLTGWTNAGVVVS